MAFPIALIVGPVLDIVKQVLGRTLPAEKISQVDRLAIEQQITLALMDQDWKQIEAEFADRANARQLAAADIAQGNAFSTTLAAVVRPIWGLGAFALVAYSVLAGIAIAPVFESIIQTLLMFYFGGRTLEKLAPAILQGYKAKQDAKVDTAAAAASTSSTLTSVAK